MKRALAVIALGLTFVALYGILDRSAGDPEARFVDPVPDVPETSVAPSIAARENPTLDEPDSSVVREELSARLRILCQSPRCTGITVRTIRWSETAAVRARSAVGLPRDEIDRAKSVRETGPEAFHTLPKADLPLFVAAWCDESFPRGVIVDAPQEFDLHLTTGCTLIGHVTSPLGIPEPDALVEVQRAFFHEALMDGRRDDVDRFAGMFAQRRTTSGPDGSFSIGGLAPARVLATATKDGSSSELSFDTVLPSEEPIELALHAGATVRGHVVDGQTGLPLSGVRIAGYWRFLRTKWEECGSAVTNDSGEFTVAGVRALASGVGVRGVLDGYGTVLQPLGRLASGASVWVDLSMERGCVASGFLHDQDGAPVDGGRVTVVETGTFEPYAVAISGADGRFTIDHLIPGLDRTVVVGKADYYEDIFYPMDLCAAVDLHFEVRAQPTLRGSVLADKLPLEGGDVHVFFESEGGTRYWQKAADIHQETGEFVVPALVSGIACVDIDVPGYALFRHERVPIENRLNELGETELLRGTELRGTVRAQGTGERVIGAHVRMGDSSIADPTYCVGAMPRSVTSDENGEYRMPDLPRAVRVPIVVDHPRFARCLEFVDLSQAGDHAFHDFALRGGGRVRVRVLDEGNRLVGKLAGAATLVTGESASIDGIDSGSELLFQGLLPGRYWIATYFGDRAANWTYGRTLERVLEVKEGDDQLITFSFFEKGRVRGRVEGPGCPVIPRLWYVTAVRDGSDESHTAQIARDLSYDIPGLPPGLQRIRLFSDDGLDSLVIEHEVLVVEGGDHELNFFIPAGGIEGFVTHEDGSPVIDGTVRVRKSPDDASPDGKWLPGITDRNGRYAFLGLDSGPNDLVIGAPGYAEEHCVVEVPADATKARRDVVLQPEGRIEATVQDRAGTVLAEATVVANRADGTSVDTLTADEAARPEGWSFGGAAEARYLLSATCESFFPAEAVVECGPGRTADATLSLRRRGDLSLRVTSPEGAPLSGVTLSITDEETGTAVATWLTSGGVTASTGALATDADGGLELLGLPEGEYRISGPAMFRTATVVGGTMTGPVLLQQIP